MASRTPLATPKWKDGIPGQGSSVELLHLRDGIELAFVFDVLSDFLLGRTSEKSSALPGYNFKPAGRSGGLIYLEDWQLSPIGLSPLWSALQARPPEGPGIRALETEGRKRIGLVDLESDRSVDPEILRDLQSSENWTLVDGAQLVDGPVPTLSVTYLVSASRKSTKRHPYLCSVCVTSESRVT